MSIEISPKSFFQQPSVADMRLIACPGAEELTGLIDKHLVRWAKDAGIDKETFIISCDCPRFQSGDAKGLVKESVRGDDIFIVVDPGNYSVTYKLFDNVNHMSPDDHFANLKRLIQAVAGKAHRVSVIMPSLYGGRQHRRVVRESLDCAVALQELQTMGVQNIITFDAHDPRVQNAVPLMSFDNAMPTYQVLKSLLKKDPEISFDKSKFTVVSPDEGAMNRNMYFSSVLGCNLGMFYKRRDYTRVVNGRNPIVAHLLRRALQEVEFDGDGLLPAVGEGERHGSRTRDFICGVRLGRDGQTAIFALGIHDFETLDPIGVVGLGILDVDSDLREGNVGLDRRDVLAAGSGDDDGRVGELDLGVHERLLLDVDRVAARVHVGAEHEARFAFEAFVEFAFGGDGALSVLRLTAGQADPVGLVDTLDMEGAVGVDVDVERIRIGFDDELLLQRAQFDQGQIVGVVDAAGRRGCAYGRNA